jgi:hypothetical protein
VIIETYLAVQTKNDVGRRRIGSGTKNNSVRRMVEHQYLVRWMMNGTFMGRADGMSTTMILSCAMSMLSGVGSPSDRDDESNGHEM